MSFSSSLEFWTTRIAIYLIYGSVFFFEFFVLVNVLKFLYGRMPKSIGVFNFTVLLIISLVLLGVAVLIILFKITASLTKWLIGKLIDKGILSEMVL
jgi:hypothetical protein